jgi:putative FmdB family regulatory protein
MPIYEYKCRKCSKTFEFMARNSSDAPESCSHCGAKELEKQLSAFAINMGSSSSSRPSKCESCPGAGTCPYAGDDDF